MRRAKTKTPRRRSKLWKVRYFLAALVLGIGIAAATSGGGSSTGSSTTTGPLSAFVSCINGHPLLDAAGTGATQVGESVLDITNNAVGSTGGIAGGVVLDASHAQAVSDGTVETALPFRFAAGPYIGSVNANQHEDVRLDIATCAQKIPGQWQSWENPTLGTSTSSATAATASTAATLTSSTTAEAPTRSYGGVAPVIQYGPATGTSGCTSDVGIGSKTTSCALAENVFKTARSAYQATRHLPGWIVGVDPATGTSVRLDCSLLNNGGEDVCAYSGSSEIVVFDKSTVAASSSSTAPTPETQTTSIPPGVDTQGCPHGQVHMDDVLTAPCVPAS